MSIYKRGSRWCYYIKIKGTRYRGTIPEARTKYQAQQAETRIRNSIFEGKYETYQSNKTFRELVEKEFLPWSRENKRSWRNDFSRIKPLLAFFGSKRLAEISSFLIEKYKISRSKTITERGTKRSPTTVNREIQLLSRVLSMAVGNRDLRANPGFEVKKFKGEVRRKRYLLPEEEARLMQALEGRRAHLRLIVMIALNTGMRRGEILRLRRQDIDFHRGEIYVTKTKTDEDRNIPMTNTLSSELTAHCAKLKSDYLFENPKTSKPIGDIKNAFVTACEDAGIEDLWFHDLRHTAATRMGERGVDPFTIAEIMGHSDIKMTRSYTHSTANAKHAAVAALERASFESGPQMGHKQEQRPVLAAVG
jgi:integrase